MAFARMMAASLDSQIQFIETQLPKQQKQDWNFEIGSSMWEMYNIAHAITQNEDDEITFSALDVIHERDQIRSVLGPSILAVVPRID